MGINKETTEVHESYGMIGACRRQCAPPQNLFGSSIRHGNTIAITIKTAEKRRSLSRDWYFAREVLVEVELSPVQFAELITCMNVGDGVPCTIRKRETNWNIADPPDISQRQVFQSEFEQAMKDIGKSYRGDVETAKDLLTKKGSITVEERKRVLGILESVIGGVTNTMPFIQSSFNKAMDKTTLEAKGEVEAFVSSKIHSLGLEALRERPVEIPYSGVDDEAAGG